MPRPDADGVGHRIGDGGAVPVRRPLGEQMTFEDVVDLEPIPGDRAYNEWLRTLQRESGPRSWDEFDGLRKRRVQPIQDVLDGL